MPLLTRLPVWMSSGETQRNRSPVSTAKQGGAELRSIIRGALARPRGDLLGGARELELIVPGPLGDPRLDQGELARCDHSQAIASERHRASAAGVIGPELQPEHARGRIARHHADA